MTFAQILHQLLDWFNLWRQSDADLRFYAIMGVTGLVLLATAFKRDAKPVKDRPMRRRRQPWYRRLNGWRLRLGKQPFYWRLGNQTADLSQTHGLVVGGSGSGKSTLVVTLILQPSISLFMSFMRWIGQWKRCHVVILSFDRSDPIEEATNYVEDHRIAEVTRWRVRGLHGWDWLQGDIEMIAEALPLGWKQGDNTGLFMQMASDSISAALHQIDDLGIERTMPELIERMDAIMDADPEIPDLARRTWVRRFRSLARVLGDSVGLDFELVELLQSDTPQVIHISSNSYTNPALTPLVGGMSIAHIKLAAEQIKNVYLILEEAAFLKNRSDLLDDLARALRARGWRIAYLSQDPNDLGSVLQVNFGVSVFMGLGPLASKARQWCADTVKDLQGAFVAQELILGGMIDQLEGYVLLKGRVRDVSLPPYITSEADRREAGGPARKPTYEWSEIPNKVWDEAETTLANYVQNHGTGERDYEYGTRPEAKAQPELDGWNGRKPRALPAARKMAMPSYYAADPDLAKVWPRLTGTWDSNNCWLVPKEMTNGEANRAKLYVRICKTCRVPKAGPHQETGYVRTCLLANGPRPVDMVKPTVDHLCHNADLYCPGGNACMHRRCMNGAHHQWASQRVNNMRQIVHEERRTDMLAGVRTEWPTTVIEEADERLAATAA